MKTNTDCIFCKIIAGEIPSDTLYQDELVTAFRDINPVTPVHILIVPNAHIEDNNDFMEDDEEFAGRIFRVVRLLAEQEGIADQGYRMIANTGEHGHQEIPHFHMHLLGGQRMQHAMG